MNLLIPLLDCAFQILSRDFSILMHDILELDYSIGVNPIRLIKGVSLSELLFQGMDHTGTFWKSHQDVG